MRKTSYHRVNVDKFRGVIQEFDEDTNDRVFRFLCKRSWYYSRVNVIYDFDDFWHIGYIGYLEAMDRVDTELLVKTKLVYLFRRISGAMADFVRIEFGSTKRASSRLAAKMLARNVSLDELVNMIGGINPELVSLRISLIELVWDSLVVRRIKVQFVVAYLKHFFGDRPMRELAEECGVSESRISQVFSKINHEHLRKDFAFCEVLKARGGLDNENLFTKRGEFLSAGSCGGL